MTLTLDMIGDYISSGATGWVFEHNQEPDKVIKIMKAFPQVGNTVLDAFQYHNYLQDRHIVRYNPAHNEYDHTWSVGMLWRPMSAKMQMYMFDELMSAQRSGGSIPTGFVKLYDSVKTFLPLNFTKDIYAEIATQDQDHADAWEDNFLSVRGPGHRHAYIISMEKLNLSKNVSGNLRPRKEVFAEVAGYLWDNLNLVTRDTAVAGNYGYRANKELVIFDPIVAPLPTYEEWRPSLAPNNVYDRLRYNYFSYLFTEEPFPVESLDEARHVNRAIRKIERQLSNNTFTTVEREAESFAVEGFPGSELDGTSMNDWSVRDLMYSNAVTGNFLEDQAKFNYGLNAESKYFMKPAQEWEVYLRSPSSGDQIIGKHGNFEMALAQLCTLIITDQVVYEAGIYGPHLRDPYHSKDLLVRYKYNQFSGNDADAVAMAEQYCIQPRDFDEAFREEFEAEDTVIRVLPKSPPAVGKKGEIAWRAINPNDYAVGLESGYLTVDKHIVDGHYAMFGKTPAAFQLAWRGYPLFEIDMEGLKYIKAPNTQWNQPRHTNIIILQDIPVDKVVPYDSDLGVGEVSKYIPYTKARGHPSLPEVNRGYTNFQQWTSRFGGVPWPGYGGSYEAERFEAPAPKQTKVKFPRAKADKIVTKVENHLRPMVEKMMACGSYRRGAQMIGDIDFVVIPKEGYTLPNMLPPNEGINWVGENKAQVIIDGEKVDFKVTTPAAWGATVLYFTGPADFNIKYRWMAKRKGLKLSEYGLFDRNTEQYLAGATETDIFTALGRPYKDPAQRQGFSKSKKKTTKKAEDKKLTPSEKYNQLKKQTESAGMKVKEVDGEIVVTRKKAEEIRCCKECDKTTGLTTIQAGTYCYDCLPINLGAEEIVCPKCDWSWQRSEGGDDLFTCHKCGFDNETYHAEDNYDATYGVKQAKIRRKLKKSIKKQNTHGTKAGQWSARKSQLLKQKYEAACERRGLRAYKGKKTSKQNDLSNWSKQKWGTASGKKSSVTGEPYFPAGAVKALKKQGLYAKATRQKRAATKAGKQRASYSKDIQNIVSDYRAESEQGPICPICYNYIPTNENPGAYPGAIARYDNKTEICSDCGTSEALAGMMAGPEAIAEWESSERTWRDYQILIMTTKSNIPEIMFGRGPELEQLRELQKKMDNKKSETLVEEVFQRRYGWNVEADIEENRRLRNSEFPMAINLGEHNFERPFQGLGSLFGAESKDSKVFGVQRHDAHRAGLHYDLRLERDGVLKSWSIPKGMPTDNRHLAIATDDHAMSWLDFDGDIPDGTYGAGKVSLDNKSTFQTVSYSPKKWVFYVNSGKYEGKYTLVHWQDNKWLISRNRDQSMSAETREFNAWYDLATDKQRDYIKRLGGDPHPDLNRRQASKLINQLARMKRALDQIDVVVDEEPYDAEDTFVSRDYPPCYLCGKPAKLDVMTAVGRRQFCNNRCRGEYEGVDYGEYPSEELEHSLEIVEYYPGFSDYDYVEDSTIDIRCRNCDWRTSQHHQEPTHTWDSTKQSFYRLHPTNTLPVFDEDGDFETYEECKHDMYIIKYLGREEYEDSLDPRSGNIVVGCRKCNFKDLLDHVDIPAGCSNRGQDKPKDFSRFFGSEYNWDDIEWTTTDRKPIEDWQDVSWEDNKYISATGIFYSPNGRIGLQLRSQQVLSPNTWSGISGFLDADETPYETVVREIHEESGLPLDKIKSWKYKVIWDNKVHRTYLFYTDTEFKPIVNEFKWEWDDWHWDTNEAWKQVPNLHPGMVAALEVIQ